jgi:acyl carrier protein
MNIEALRKILTAQLGIHAETVTPTSRLREDLGADSLDLVEIVMEIEEEAGIVIPDDEAAALLTVQDILDYVNN